MKTYKTKNGAQFGFVPGIGAIINGVLKTDKVVENPNLELVDEGTTGTPAQPAEPVTATEQNNKEQQ